MYFCSLLLACIPIACVLSLHIQAPLLNEPSSPKKRISFKDVLSGSLRPETTSFQWSSSGKDGSYIETNSTTHDLWLAHVVDKERELLVNTTILANLLEKHSHGKHFTISGYKIQPGGRKVLVTTNYVKQYRWSGFAEFFVYDPESADLKIVDEHETGEVRYAGWSPIGDSIAYVRKNDLYLYRDGIRTRLTHDGSANVFNGVPDWVYEEEIFSSTNTLWFSPDSRYLAFLRFNETEVPIYRVPYYMTGQEATAYPRELELKYPKAGQPIPSVSIHLVDLDNLDEGAIQIDFDAFEPKNLLIGEVAWITDAHSHLAWKCFNRVQDHEKLVVFDFASNQTFIATDRKESNGWIDNTQSIRYVPRRNCYVYLSDEDGWSHLYLQDVNATKPLQLTKGEWEVTKILYVSTDHVYYQSTEGDSTERHVYDLDLSFLSKTALTNPEKEGYSSFSFSTGGGYSILTNVGPGLPRQELFSTSSLLSPIKVLQNNDKLAEKLSEYELPTTSWTTIKHPEGFEMNALEIRPPNFDANKKYPLLLNPYGGPGAQETGKVWSGADWWNYVASDPQLEYVILTVDGRGTGFKGKPFRSAVTSKLGHYEALDQAFAAEFWSNKSYIDSNKIIVQGWSYGGYLSGKCIELNSDIFSSAIITAPVSSWLFYDAFYTERYMKLPQDQPDAYYTSSIHNTSGFSNARGGVLLQHGTGDDNVHFQHSAVLLDLLMAGSSTSATYNSSNTNTIAMPNLEENIFGGKFRNDDPFRHQYGSMDTIWLTNIASSIAWTQTPVSPSKITTQFFTDSDHRIEFHGSTLFLRKQMARWLYREKRRKEVDRREAEMEEQWLESL